MAVPARAEGLSHVVLIDSYPPFYVWDGEKAEGPFVDTIREAFRRMGDTVEFKHSTWKRSLHEIRHGGATALCSAAKVRAREEYAVYPDEPLGEEENWVTTLVTFLQDLKVLADLEKYTVGIVDGYTYGAVFDSNKTVPRDSVMVEDLLLKKLLVGRLEVIIGSDAVLSYNAAQTGDENRLKFHFKLVGHPLYLMFSKARPGSHALVESFSNTLRQMRDEGVLK